MKSDSTRAILLMSSAAVLFSLMSVCVKSASLQASVAQTVFFRALVGLPFLYFLVRRYRFPLIRVAPWLWVRSLCGFMSLGLSYYAVSRIPLGNAVILNSTAPIFVSILSPLVARERVPPLIYALFPLFLSGVFLIVKPQLHFDAIPSFAALLSGLFAALAYLSVRKLGKSEPAIMVVFYFTAISAILSAVPAALTWNPFHGVTFLYLVAGGVLATAAQLLMTRAYYLERASLVSLFAYVGAVCSFVWGILFFGEHPDIRSIAGAGLIVIAGIIASQWPSAAESFET